MKKLILLLTIVFSMKLAYSQNNTHQTISDLKVGYKAVQQSTAVPNPMMEMKGVPQASITLKPNANAVKIYFKMMNAKTNEMVYQVNYTFSSSPVINNAGVKLFEKVGQNVFISTGEAVGLKPYVYQIETEDAQNVKTSTYSATK